MELHRAALPATLEIRAEYHDEVLRLEITDDGPGFSQNRIDKPTRGVGISEYPRAASTVIR